MDKLTELKESLANFDKKYKEIKADMGKNPEMDKMMEYFYDMFGRMREYMWGMEDNFNNKLNNHMSPQGAIHPPMLKTASHVENYLEMCGMSNDCEVVKPKIQVKASRQGNKEFEIDLNIPKKTK